jgi:O-acetyl-ADP-ribose deacetylase (regulator of RNase III)
MNSTADVKDGTNMTIEYRVGDLFEPDLDVDAIGHGVNCRGVMGAGIAKLFKQNYFDMYWQYAMRCKAGLLWPGEVFTWFGGDKVIFNIASQDLPGANAQIGWLSEGLSRVSDLAIANDWTVALPWIGAGIGGLPKESVKELFESYANARNGQFKLMVVTHPSDV